ncbi:MAG TPA: murein biosynthesis integral membrane protein MurJ [Anaerolineae bacterium]|nr:murein biosynthesis integral membrane protein MurJ [Anaerolineae bacterium]
MSAGEGHLSATARVARAAGLVILLFVASRALGLVREMVISHQFGTGGTLDAYLAAFRLPDILFQVVAGGALASAFIPTFATYWERGDRAGAWRMASAVVNLVLIVTVLLAAASWLLAPWLVRTAIAPGFGADRQALTAGLMRIMLVTPAIFGVSGVIMGILNARQHFALPAVAPVLYNLGIIGGAVFLAPSMDVRGLAVGVVAGSLAHLLVQIPALTRQGMRYAPVLGLRDAGVREVGRLVVPRMVGLAAVQLNFLVNTILASGLAAGSLAALNYAWLLMLLPQGVVAQAVATAAFPTFSAQAARGDLEEMRSTLMSTLRAVLYLALPAAAGLVVLRGPLVEVIFQRGAFTAASTGRVAGALALYALGLPAHSAVEILVRAFYAMHDTRTPVGISVAAMVLNIGLSLALMAGFGAAGWAPYGGLALANSLATTLEMGALLGVLRRRLGGLGGRSLSTSLARCGVAAAVMAVLLLALLRLLAGQSAWLLAGAGLAAGAAVYAGVSLALGATEPRAMAAALQRRGSRRGGAETARRGDPQ